jgi:hypothetical protein
MTKQDDKRSSAEYHFTRLRFASAAELEIERVNALDRFSRLMEAQNLLTEFGEKFHGSEEELEDGAAEEEEGIRLSCGVPDSVFLFTEGHQDDRTAHMSWLKQGIRKIFTGRMPEDEVYAWLWDADESDQFDFWWVLFDQGLGYYERTADVSILDPIEEVARFARRNMESC